MKKCMFKFDFNYDKEKLLKESQLLNYTPVNYNNFLTRSSNETNNDNLSFVEKDKQWWDKQTSWNASREPKSKNANLSESKRIIELFKKVCNTDKIRPSFLTQKKDTEVLLHIDPGTLCKINLVLQGGQTPINFQGYGDELYEVALLNITLNHSVPIQTDQDRILFTLRFTHHSYNYVRRNLQNYFRSSK